MSESKKDDPPGKGAPDGKKTSKKKTPAVEDQPSDSEDIERAVYDGMQDLRVKKPRSTS